MDKDGWGEFDFVGLGGERGRAKLRVSYNFVTEYDN